jgi:hypothetical protein
MRFVPGVVEASQTAIASGSHPVDDNLAMTWVKRA